MIVSARADSFWIVTCPNRACLKAVKVEVEDRIAVCPHCGNRWEWRAKRVVRAGRKRA